ncbi:hypothetical protein [Blastococcus sp. SYSU D00820]
MSRTEPSIVLLANRPPRPGHSPVLPLPAGLRLYAEGIDPALVRRHAAVARRPSDADVAVVRTPGSAAGVPAVVLVDRPADVPGAAAVLLTAGAADDAVLDVLFGAARPAEQSPVAPHDNWRPRRLAMSVPEE